MLEVCDRDCLTNFHIETRSLSKEISDVILELMGLEFLHELTYHCVTTRSHFQPTYSNFTSLIAINLNVNMFRKPPNIQSFL